MIPPKLLKLPAQRLPIRAILCLLCPHLGIKGCPEFIVDPVGRKRDERTNLGLLRDLLWKTAT
jgi:hypothetical protein